MFWRFKKKATILSIYLKLELCYPFTLSSIKTGNNQSLKEQSENSRFSSNSPGRRKLISN